MLVYLMELGIYDKVGVGVCVGGGVVVCCFALSNEY